MSRSKGGKRRPLENPLNRRKLIRQLAATDLKHDELAAEYGVDRTSVSRFRKRHEQEIEAVRADHLDEFAGLLIADKAARLSVYEQLLLEAVDKGERMVAVRILRNAAEELGHLPSRMQISGAVDVHTTYTVAGEDGRPVNLNALK